MSFKDKFNEYKEKQETKNYFRSHNDQFLDTQGWIKVILLGIVGAIIVGVVLGLVISTIRITSMWFYLIAAYIISNLVTKISDIHSQQMGILAALLAVLSFIVVNMTILYYPIVQSGMGFSPYFGPIDLFVQSIRSFYTGSIFTTVIAIVSVFIAYQQAQ